MKSRGIIKWLPFSALEEQLPQINKIKREKNKIKKPHISQDLAEHINRILLNIPKTKVLITYFAEGFIYQINEQIKKVDSQNHLLYTSTKIISFKNLLNLELD